MLDRTLTVRVARTTRLTAEVSAFELVHPWGGTLPGYRAGAHIDVHLPGGFMRQYSLASATQTPTKLPKLERGLNGAEAAPCKRYLIGVKREQPSRGGSASLHARVQVGDLLAISTPRNNFPLHRGAAHHWLLAGGIGITPLLAMSQELVQEGAAFTLCVFARSRAHRVFADELAALGAHVRYHFDEDAAVTGPAAHRIDLPALLARPEPGHHLYLCGPGGFMQAVLAAAAHWPEERVHLEYFAPPSAAGQDVGQGAGRDEPFTLVIAGRGIEVPVAADQSAVDALHDLGIEVPTSCAQGMCGTCVVPLAQGVESSGGNAPDHRDHCLTATERRSKVALCCSRAQPGGRLVVELP